MKYVLALSILFMFCFQPVQLGLTQIPATLTPAEIENKRLKEIIKQQLPDVQERRDSLSILFKKIQDGELKPKVVYKTRYRTRYREVRDTVYLPYPIDSTDHMEVDYVEEPVQHDTVYLPAPVPKKKKTFLQRILN